MSFGIISAVYSRQPSCSSSLSVASQDRKVRSGPSGTALPAWVWPGATVFGPGIGNYAVIAVMLVIGSVIGWYVAKGSR